jgi:hypothetical protein
VDKDILKAIQKYRQSVQKQREFVDKLCNGKHELYLGDNREVIEHYLNELTKAEEAMAACLDEPKEFFELLENDRSFKATFLQGTLQIIEAKVRVVQQIPSRHPLRTQMLTSAKKDLKTFKKLMNIMVDL